MALDTLRDLAATQYGVFNRQQAEACGISRSARRHLLASGAWQRLTPRVFSIAGTPATPEQQAIAATLDAESDLSHESSAAVWRLPGFRLRPIHVVGEKGRTRPASELAVVHTSTHLPASHRTVHHGIPVTTPVRTLFDLAPRVHPLRLPRLVDAAWAMHLVTGAALHRALDDHAERGRPGIQIMREILADRPVSYRPPDSNLEARFLEIAVSVGLLTLRRQVDLGADGWVGRVDFRDSILPLVFEIDSERFHGSLSDQEADGRRRQALIDAGFDVVRIDEFDVWHRPDRVREQIRAARRRLDHRFR